MLNKKTTILLLFLCTTLAYAKSTRKYRAPEDCNFATDYKSFTVNKDERTQNIIEHELFENQEFNHKMIISRSDGGINYDYHFYKVNEDNLCLGIKTFNGLQEEAIIYVNTNKECGTKCKVYLSKQEDKQIFYFWKSFCK